MANTLPNQMSIVNCVFEGLAMQTTMTYLTDVVVFYCAWPYLYTRAFLNKKEHKAHWQIGMCKFCTHEPHGNARDGKPKHMDTALLSVHR